ncbi:MAG TPA: hypothetical protein VE650_18170 [Acetobacteraceae bacterium]|nr:hypothetical protein [Acetobacteraceae bacterium]
MRIFLLSVVVVLVIGAGAGLVLPRIAGESSEAAYTAPSARP